MWCKLSEFNIFHRLTNHFHSEGEDFSLRIGKQEEDDIPELFDEDYYLETRGKLIKHLISWFKVQ